MALPYHCKWLAHIAQWQLRSFLKVPNFIAALSTFCSARDHLKPKTAWRLLRHRIQTVLPTKGTSRNNNRRISKLRQMLSTSQLVIRWLSESIRWWWKALTPLLQLSRHVRLETIGRRSSIVSKCAGQHLQQKFHHYASNRKRLLVSWTLLSYTFSLQVEACLSMWRGSILAVVLLDTRVIVVRLAPCWQAPMGGANCEWPRLLSTATIRSLLYGHARLLLITSILSDWRQSVV